MVSPSGIASSEGTADQAVGFLGAGLTPSPARSRVLPTDTKGARMSRVMADCRRSTSDRNCSLTIMGDEDEVLRVATKHAIEDHGHEDTPEFRAKMRETLEPAAAYTEDRMAEPFPAWRRRPS